MASVQKPSSGSWVLKGIIAALIVILIYSIYSPNQQWKQQGRDEVLARQRMENLYNAGNLYFFLTKHFPKSIEEIVAVLDTARVDAEPAHFEIEPKQNMNLLAEREDLLKVEYRSAQEEARLVQLQTLIRDSLLITLEDTMRIASFEVKDLGSRQALGADGTAKTIYQYRIWGQMKPLFAGIGSDTLCLDSEFPITVIKRKAGELSRDLWASTQGTFIPRADGSFFAPGQTVKQPVKSYSLSLPLTEIGVCPTTGKPFVLKHVGKFKYKGSYGFTVDGAGEPLTTLAQKQAFLGALRDQASGALGAIFGAMADSAMKAGDTQYRIPDDVKTSITVRETLAVLPKIKPGMALAAAAEQSQIAGLDSLDFYTSDAKRGEILFPEFQGHAADAFSKLLEDAGVQGLVQRVKLQGAFEPVQIDTVGMAVVSPITGTETFQSGWKRIFEVNPPANHGQIYNGTKSWE
ncbi:MAG: hypothetical protein WC326_12155 [Candidatus Delongbacteria bacterium]